jgi:hypothetical protein
MKRFWRWVFNGLAALSLVLCGATGSLWLRSFYVADNFERWTSLNAKQEFTEEMLCSHSG